jgi:hypothetical protein
MKNAAPWQKMKGAAFFSAGMKEYRFNWND